MQTFLPYPSFARSAAVLDYRRLGKQRVEARQILNTLLGRSYGWINHPAVKMWKGREGSLAEYGSVVCVNWIERGYKDSLLDDFLSDLELAPSLDKPLWFGNEDFHRSHRANLVRKEPAFYIPHFGELIFEPYLWPVDLK